MSITKTTLPLLRWGIREILLGVRLPDDTPPTPQTALATAIDTSAGPVRSVAVTEPDAFLSGGLFSFYDNRGEEDIRIADSWDEETSPIPLDFSGVGYDGIQHDHPQGALVGSGLRVFDPINVENMLKRDHGLLFFDVTKLRRYAASTNQLEPNFAIRLEYRLLGTQDRPLGEDDALMDPTIWSERQRRIMDDVCDAVADRFASRWSLMTSEGELAIGQGDPNNASGDFWSVVFQPILVTAANGNVLQYQSVSTFQVRGKLVEIDV